MTDAAPDAPALRRRLKRWWIAAAVAAAVAVVVALVAMPDERDTAVDRDGDRRAPTFSVPDLRDPERTIELVAFAGQPVVLNFWASWCVPCRREMPAFQAVAEEHKNDVVFIGMNHQDSRDDALDLLADTGVKYPSGFDPEGKVAQAYGLFGMPTTVLITADGRVAARRTGEVSRRELEQAIEELLER
jgi:cytochrome c biogenesis protein CcmG/thiol:disulfide interchange protein DsbE